MKIMAMRVNYMENPMGFDLKNPLMGWMVDGQGAKSQSAYRLQLALDDGFNAPLYDSGKQISDDSVGVPLPCELLPRTRYYWRVMVWDEQDRQSDFSTPAYFETARYDEPWNADWIGYDQDFPQLSRGFVLDKPVRRARLYACGVGLYTMTLNGRKVGDEYLTPGFNAYDAWLQYQTYDITDQLLKGPNALGAWLGNGYYKGRVNWPGLKERRNIYGDRLGLIAEMIVEFEDGSELRIPTDTGWRAARGPFTRTEIYDGEAFDARLITPGFGEPGFDDSGWEHASVVDIDKAKLTARLSPPINVMHTLKPVALINTPAGERVIDFGQNMAGWVRMQVDAPSGTEIKLQFGEALDKDGNFYRENMRTALAETIYTSDGQAREYAPSFTFYGFRYVKLTGWPGEVDLSRFVAEAVHSQMQRTGGFECSDERVNRLFLNALWGQRGNFVDVPTDCPQRDERLGWTGDAQVFCATACMNMEADAFYRKYLHDLAIEQADCGYVPVVAPNFLKEAVPWAAPTTGWGDAATIIPWTLYQYFGDKAVLEIQYQSMKDWVEYMRAQDKEGNDRYGGFHLGDWLSQDTPDPDTPMGLTPTELIATAYYAYSTEILAKTAAILCKGEDAKTYFELAARIKNAFRAEFVTPGGRVAAETQTASVLALGMDMLLPKDRPVVAGHLARRLFEDKLYLTTGFLGTPLLCPVLSENGYNEYAYHLLFNNGFPSWLYEVEHGATTIWERWNSVREDGSFGPVSMNSLNHYALGAIAEWMYRYVCGINVREDAPGFKKSLIRPMPSSLLKHAKADIRTQYGTIACGWELKEGMITLGVTVPFNTEAEIHLPDAEDAEVVENGQPVTGTVFTRGAGEWMYHYKHSGKLIGKRTPERPRFG